MYEFGMFLGAFISAYLWSRLFLWLARKGTTGLRAIAIAHVMTAIVGGTLAAYGSADGGEPKFAAAGLPYLVLVALWAAVDVMRHKGRAHDHEVPETRRPEQ